MWGCIIAGVMVIIIGIFASSIGVFGHYRVPEAIEGVFSAMAIFTLNPVLAGIVIAAMLGAAMSSASGLLVALGATFSIDLYNRFLNPREDLDNLHNSKLISRIAVGLCAIAGVLLSFKVTSILDAIIIFNYPYMGSLLIPLLAGVLWKGATKKSGAGDSGCDHWESAATNPCSTVSPEELTRAMLDDNDGYDNGISHYIECREGYDRLLDIENMGGKIRDTGDEFKGAAFRDESTKLMFDHD
jgi:hypothetical protein